MQCSRTVEGIELSATQNVLIKNDNEYLLGKDFIMPRITTVSIETAPEESRPILEKIKSAFGRVPNIFGSMAHSPAALKALTGLFDALEKGSLTGKAHEAIALRVGQMNGCEYCTAAHTAKAKMAGATEEETIAFRKGTSDDTKIQAILKFVDAILEKRGKVSNADVQSARKAEITDAELIETVAIISCNRFTNYINALVQTDIDFPPAPVLE